MAYVTFTRTWWKDAKCTRPGPGRSRYTGNRYDTAQEAREACAAANTRFGLMPGGNGRADSQGRGPKGLAMEFEEA